MLTQNIELWRVRLDTEQAQIDAMGRRMEQLRIASLTSETRTRADIYREKLNIVARNHVIMVQMREMLRDRLGQAGLLAAIEGK